MAAGLNRPDRCDRCDRGDPDPRGWMSW